MSAHKKFQLKAQNQESAVDPYMPHWRTGMHNEYETSNPCNNILPEPKRYLHEQIVHDNVNIPSTLYGPNSFFRCYSGHNLR